MDRRTIADFEDYEDFGTAIVAYIRELDGKNLIASYIPSVYDAALQEETISGAASDILALQILGMGQDDTSIAVRILTTLQETDKAIALLRIVSFLTLSSFASLPEVEGDRLLQAIRAYIQEKENGIIVDSLLTGKRPCITGNGLEELTEEEIEERRREREGL